MDEFLEISQSIIVFSDEYETTGVFIETMDYTGPIFANFPIEVGNLANELIDESSETSLISGSRVSIDTCIFTYNQKITIFSNYF
jgi:hypothetical protein